MSATIKIKNSSTAGAAPTSSDLVQGELAVNVTDKRLFTENASGTVVELGTNPSSITLPDGSASAPTLLHSGDTNTGLFFPAADTVGITTGGTERARIDSSGNLGIGTSSPVQKQHLDGGAGDTYLQFSNSTTGATSSDGSRIGIASADTTLRIQNLESGSIRFDTAGSERMRLDASGNLGLGVTPSAWASSYKMLQTSTAASFGGNNSNITIIGSNYYNDGVSKYIGTGAAALYLQDAGVHKWLYAGSGSAGGTISFTQAMTLDASGNLGVGTTSPSYRLDVAKAGAGVTARIQNSSNSIGTYFYNDTANAYIASEAAINNGMLMNTGSGYVAFVTGTGTERARIDSSGNLLVGTTSAYDGTYRGIQVTSSSDCAVFKTTTSSGNIVRWNSATTGDNTFIGFYTETSITFRGGITYNRGGGLVAYNTTSDYRAKTVNGAVQNALTKVASLKPCTGRMNGAEFDIDFFVAHELQEVVPSAVTGQKDAVNEDGTPNYQMVDKSALIPLLTAAIQELKAIVDAQAAEIAALKGQA